ncbi:MAG: exlusion protein FxsA [Gammaproteobacteria bacterium]|nr:MAG: exlusion protein FxsA [Gammaproteobacteria bacterium]RKZ73238.1 MAG: exlusion protein FxsA [Gammaproteobacteria bacterium]
MTPFQSLLLLFILIPIFEIYLLISVGSFLGVLPTILLVIFTAVLGTYLLRAQGLATLQKVQDTLQQGQLPTFVLLEGIFILLGGALLLTPGFFTDVVGFSCLMPAVRKQLIHWLSQRIQMKQSDAYSSSSSKPRTKVTIDGECRREE